MATITALDVAYRILEGFRTTISVEDSLDVREAINFVQNYRALFIKQKVDKYALAPIDESYVQDLGAVPLEIVDSSNHATLKTNYKVARTVSDIPLPIETSNGLGLFTRIAPSDRLEQRFKLVNYNAIPYMGNGKFNLDQVFATQVGQKIYIYSKDTSAYGMKFINIRGVFGNPFEAMLFTEPTLTLSAQWEKEYPINASMAEMIINTAIKELYRYTATGIKDNISNQADDAVNIK